MTPYNFDQNNISLELFSQIGQQDLVTIGELRLGDVLVYNPCMMHQFTQLTTEPGRRVRVLNPTFAHGKSRIVPGYEGIRFLRSCEHDLAPTDTLDSGHACFQQAIPKSKSSQPQVVTVSHRATVAALAKFVGFDLSNAGGPEAAIPNLNFRA